VKLGEVIGVRWFVEKPSSLRVTRRGFLKVLGVTVAAIAIGAYKVTDLFVHRNRYIKMRQSGQYKDDERVRKTYSLAASQQNPMIKRFYDEFANQPFGEVSESLLHTRYFRRTEGF